MRKVDAKVELKDKYPVHYAKCTEIVESINHLSNLINELGELEKTGIDNIDNLVIALNMRHKKTMEVFIEDGKDKYKEDEMHAG